MKRYAIRRLYSYFETTEDEITSNVFDEKLDSLDKEIKLLLEKYYVFVYAVTDFCTAVLKIL